MSRIPLVFTEGMSTFKSQKYIDIDMFVNCNCIDTRWQ